MIQIELTGTLSFPTGLIATPGTHASAWPLPKGAP